MSLCGNADGRQTGSSRPMRQAAPLVSGAHIQRAAQQRPGQCAEHYHPASQDGGRSEEHTSELQSLMRISYAVFCLKKKKTHPIYKHISLKQQTSTNSNSNPATQPKVQTK